MVAQIFGVLLLLVQQLVSTTTTIQLHVQVIVKIVLEMLFLAYFTAMTQITTQLFAVFQVFKIILKIKHKHTNQNLHCSVNLDNAITQVI